MPIHNRIPNSLPQNGNARDLKLSISSARDPATLHSEVGARRVVRRGGGTRRARGGPRRARGEPQGGRGARNFEVKHFVKGCVNIADRGGRTHTHTQYYV